MTEAEYVPRLTRPEAGNRYYIRKVSGGWSSAVKGSPTDGDCDVLSNCVGYAVGRFNEIGGWGACKYLKPTNAELFMKCKGDCETGDIPRVGSCMVWQGGPTLKGADGCGHVAIVEKVISEAEVVTSESCWNGKAFYTKVRKRGAGNWGAGSKFTFLGFIYNPGVTKEDEKMDVDKLIKEMTDEQALALLERIQGALDKQPVPAWAEAGLEEAKAVELTDGSHPMQLIPRYQAAILAKRAAFL